MIKAKRISLPELTSGKIYNPEMASSSDTHVKKEGKI